MENQGLAPDSLLRPFQASDEDGLALGIGIRGLTRSDLAHGAVDACRKMGYRTTITVLDSSGALKAFLRDDGTGPHTISLSRDKAYTAITLANRFATSGTFATARNSTLGSPMTNIQGVVGVAGGVPIKYRGEVIGGVGSSGAVGGDKDELCSQAGIDAVADQLR